VQLTVIDTGCGMGPQTCSISLNLFNTTKETGKGTGLGLATVYGIVTQNKGQILVESELGTGTSFKVLFPVVLLGAEVALTEGMIQPSKHDILPPFSWSRTKRPFD